MRNKIGVNERKLIEEQIFLIIRDVFFKDKSSKKIEKIQGQVYKELENVTNLNSKKIENNIVNLFFNNIKKEEFNTLLKEWYQARIKRDFNLIKRWIIGEKALDYGCGKGDIGLSVSKKLRKEVILADVEDRNVVNLPFYLVDEVNTAFKDKQFDTTFIINVIHHTKYPDQVIKEIARITKKRIIIFEHNLLREKSSRGLSNANLRLLFRIIEGLFYCPGKKKRPGMNFQDYSGLKKMFDRYRLNLISEECVPFLNKDIFILDGWLFVLDLD